MATGTKKETLLFVEFHDGKPFSVETSENTYDVEWCKRDGCLYSHNSGGGGSYSVVRDTTEYWAADGHELRVSIPHKPWTRPIEPGETVGKRLKRLPKGYTRASILELVQDCDTECNYCSVCDDHLPTSDTNHPCEHIHWCESIAWWSKPGERCDPGCECCLERDEPTKAETCILGRIGEGHGLLAQDWWSEHTGHWERRDPGHVYCRDDCKEMRIVYGYGLAAIAAFEAMEG